MAYIARNQENHERAWSLQVPWAVREWAAWFYVSELMRRHPDVFTPVERFAMQKSLIDMENLSTDGSLMIRVNRTGSITVWGGHRHPENCPVEENVFPKDDAKIHLLDVYLADDPRSIIRELEVCAGLTPPRETPPTGQTTIGPRVIAELIRLHLHTESSILPIGIFQSAEYGDSIDKAKLMGIHGLENLAKLDFEPIWTSINHHPVPLYSGLFGIYGTKKKTGEVDESERTLLFVIDIKKGLLHSKTTTIDLLRRYREQKSDILLTAISLLK